MRHYHLFLSVPIFIGILLLTSFYAIGQRPVLVKKDLSSTHKVVRSFVEKDIENDIKGMQSCVPLRANGPVKRIIHRYLYENKPKTEEMIGRAAMYFPMIEAMLAENNIPDEIKYLAIIESSLIPTAKSRVGAMGIWQIMPATGRELGLRIDDVVDERLDPIKSTEAAIKYLNRSNKRFKSWTLALAAYNSGGGRVNRAIKRSHSKNFWKLKQFLPKETQSYVPAFMAASYVMKHYEEYGLAPVYPSRDLLLKSPIKLTESTTIQALANIAGIDSDILATLNPSYYTGFVPAHATLYIPERVLGNVKSYYGMATPDEQHIVNASFVKNVHIVSEGESLWTLAQIYRCTPTSIAEWNGLSSTKLEKDMALVIYEPKAGNYKQEPTLIAFQQREKVQAIDLLSKQPFEVVQEVKDTDESDRISASRQRRIKVKRYTIRKSSSMVDVANWLDIRLEELLEMNSELIKKRRLTPGTVIKVPGH